jgi:hypothetical protein
MGAVFTSRLYRRIAVGGFLQAMRRRQKVTMGFLGPIVQVRSETLRRVASYLWPKKTF